MPTKVAMLLSNASFVGAVAANGVMAVHTNPVVNANAFSAILATEWITVLMETVWPESAKTVDHHRNTVQMHVYFAKVAKILEHAVPNARKSFALIVQRVQRRVIRVPTYTAESRLVMAPLSVVHATKTFAGSAKTLNIAPDVIKAFVLITTGWLIAVAARFATVAPAVPLATCAVLGATRHVYVLRPSDKSARNV